MKNIFLCLTLILLTTACSSGAPSEAAVQTAIAATAVAIPTATMIPTATPKPANTPEPANTAEPTADDKPTADAPKPLLAADERHIYAAAIRQMYSVNHNFADPPEFPLVYIATSTDDGSLLDAPITSPQILSVALRQAVAAELTDLQIKIIWVESIDEVPLGPSNGLVAGGQGIFITLGNIIPQDDGTVQLPIYMLCGSLCLSGKTYVLAEVDGDWQVTGSVGAEIEA